MKIQTKHKNIKRKYNIRKYSKRVYNSKAKNIKDIQKYNQKYILYRMDFFQLEHVQGIKRLVGRELQEIEALRKCQNHQHQRCCVEAVEFQLF